MDFMYSRDTHEMTGVSTALAGRCQQAAFNFVGRMAVLQRPAACVRFATWIFCRIDFMWTLTVASVLSDERDHFLAYPRTTPSRI
jgi:hypothetical protein